MWMIGCIHEMVIRYKRSQNRIQSMREYGLQKEGEKYESDNTTKKGKEPGGIVKMEGEGIKGDAGQLSGHIGRHRGIGLHRGRVDLEHHQHGAVICRMIFS